MHHDVCRIGEVQHRARPFIEGVAIEVGCLQAANPARPAVAFDFGGGVVGLDLPQQGLSFCIGDQAVIALGHIPPKKRGNAQEKERCEHPPAPSLDTCPKSHWCALMPELES